jgi:hypothetical protein
MGILALTVLLYVPAAHADDSLTYSITVTDTETGVSLTAYDPYDSDTHEPYHIQLGVGETRTFEIAVDSSEQFIFAAAMPDAYYPGRGVSFHGRDQVTRDNYALVYLTVTGKGSTAGFEAVCDWPYPEVCTEAGQAPLSIVAGMRFKGGVTVGEVFPLSVIVTE